MGALLFDVSSELDYSASHRQRDALFMSKLQGLHLILFQLLCVMAPLL